MTDDQEPSSQVLQRRMADLPAPGTPSGQVCPVCHLPIRVAQHYVRVAVLADTAGLENALEAPTVLWSGIFDTPACGGLGLMQAASTDPMLLDVFGRA